MKILFLSKRHPQGRCLLDRPYGRFHYLPTGLASSGHSVTLALIGHRNQPAQTRHQNGVDVRSFDVRQQGPVSVWQQLRQLCRQQNPDWIVGCSDIYFGIAATRLARESGARSLIDSYDDFEAYMPWAWPLHILWRTALRRADLCTAAGPQLAEHLARISGAPQVCVVPMAADSVFLRKDRRGARETLGLAPEAVLFGYLGSIAAGRDLPTLWNALPLVQAARPDATCVASGRLHSPLAQGVQHLGYLPDESIPQLLSSLNLAVITAEPGRFGLGSYPSKLYEAIACGIPMVCADLPNLRWIAGTRARYYRPGDPESLAEAIVGQLQDSPVVDPLPDWSDVTKLLEKRLRSHGT